MATINGSVSSNSDAYSFYITWSESKASDYISTNKTTVTATACIKCTDHYAYASGLAQKLVIDGTEFTDSVSVDLSEGVTVNLITGSKTITHNADGSKKITISADCDLPDGNGYGPVWGSASGTATLTTIPRYATSVQSLKSKTSSSITMNWSSDSTIDYIWYSKNNGSSWTGINVTDGKSGSYTISSLSAGTTYKIKTRVRRKDSHLTTDSSALSVTTYKKTTPTISLSSKTVNSITVSSSCNVTVSSTQYRIKKSGGSYGSYQTSATFTGLSPNTAYVIEVKKAGKDSGESGTATLSVTTYDIAKISSASNFNLGDNLPVSYSNPSGSTIKLSIQTSTGSDFYCNDRNVSGSSYTFNFTDTELDTLYKAMGKTNNLKVRVYLKTFYDSTKYYANYKDITITLTGNQKTVHIGKSGEIKRGKVFIARSGIKRGVLWRGVNGTSRRCI